MKNFSAEDNQLAKMSDKDLHHLILYFSRIPINILKESRFFFLSIFLSPPF